MGNTTIKIERTQRHVSELEQLKLRVENAKRIYGEAAANAQAVWKMFDDVVEEGNKEAKNDLAELAAYCDSVKTMAYQELDEAKRQLLSLSN